MLDQTRKFYFSPDDDTQNAFLDFIKTATKQILIADYSFNLEPLVQDLITLHQNGIDVQLVLDKSQSAGNTEKPVLDQLKQAGVPMIIGTSSLRKIMHDKFTVIDSEWIQAGSWNYTATASKEDNFFFIEHNPDLAVLFIQKWQAMHDWIVAHEPQ